MSQDFEAVSFYADLDAVFDTRLAVLHRLGVEKAFEAITNGYFQRKYDEFHGVDTEAFKAAYAARDVSVLTQSMSTSVFDLIDLFIKETLSAVVSTPFRRQPKLIINTYPYILTEEQEHVLMHGFIARTKHLADIELISSPYEELTPDWVKRTCSHLAMYNYWDWLEVHSQNRLLESAKCTSIRLYGPQLVKSKEAMEQLKHESVFDAIETYSGMFIKLTLLPVQVFCTDLERYTKRHKPEA